MNHSFFNLAKEFQGRSYESMVAHTTIVFTRYIMLSTQSRNNEDLRTIGDLFFNCCDELEDIQFFEVIKIILELLKNALQEKLSLTKESFSCFWIIL